MLKISEEEYREIEAAAKANKNKRVAKRLEVLEMRYAKKSNTEIAAKTGFNKLYVTTLIQIYKRQGLVLCQEKAQNKVSDDIEKGRRRGCGKRGKGP